MNRALMYTIGLGLLLLGAGLGFAVTNAQAPVVSVHQPVKPPCPDPTPSPYITGLNFRPMDPPCYNAAGDQGD